MEGSNVEREAEASSTGSRQCCTAEHSLGAHEIATDVATISALANETRYEALRLVAAVDDGVCGCEIEPALEVSQSAISQALSRLQDAGLLTRRTEGQWRYYSATENAHRLLDALEECRNDA